MLGPTFLKLRFGVDEVVTTLLLNFVMLLFVQMMLEGPLKDPMGLGWPQSEPILDDGRAAAAGRAHAPPCWARHRPRGLRRGAYPDGADRDRPADPRRRRERDGGPLRRHPGDAATMLVVGALSGGLAGLAGAPRWPGSKGYLTSDLSPGFGYAGIVVAMLAGSAAARRGRRPPSSSPASSSAPTR